MNSIFVLALIVAVVARIVTQESLFIELQAWASKQQRHSRFAIRKLTYPLQCQFCFSVWVSAALSTYLYFHSPFDLVWLSAADYGPIAIVASTFALTGLANAYLIVYEFATLRVQTTRQGTKIRALNLEARQLELQEFKFGLKEIERQRRAAASQRPFLERVAGGAYGYPWNENPSSAKDEGLT